MSSLALGLAAALLAAPEHVALVVGSNVGRPDSVPLRHAQRDAERVRMALAELSDAEVVLLLEPTPAELDARLAQMALAQGNDARVTFYYAGHADEDNLHLGRHPYPIARLREWLERAEAKVTLAVIDGCRANLGTAPRGLEQVPEQAIDIVLPTQAKGSVWIRATSAGELSQESDRLNGGVFSHYWVAGLRGAADRDGNGLVTLAEAYAFAANNTQGFGAGVANAPLQRPSYEYALEGTQDLVLTRTGRAPSVIELPAWPGTLFVVRRLPAGDAVMTVEARQESTRVALPTGRFQILGRRKGRVVSTTIDLPWGGTSRLARSDFVVVETEEARARGSLPEPPLELYLAAHGGVSHLGNDPWTGQRANVELVWRLRPPLQTFHLGLSGEWTGNESTLRSGDLVRSDAARLAGLLVWGFDAWILHLSAGFLLGARITLQHATLRGQPQQRVSWGPVLLARAGLRLALYGGFGISFTAGAGFLWHFVNVGRYETEPLRDSFLGEFSVGPSYRW